MSKPKVYFTKTLTPEKLIDMYEILQKPLKGKIVVKVVVQYKGEAGNRGHGSSGEIVGQNSLNQ